MANGTCQRSRGHGGAQPSALLQTCQGKHLLARLTSHLLLVVLGLGGVVVATPGAGVSCSPLHALTARHMVHYDTEQAIKID